VANNARLVQLAGVLAQQRNRGAEEVVAVVQDPVDAQKQTLAVARQ
jgi:hypothetical protein